MPGKLLRRPTSQRPRGPKSARKARRRELGAYGRGELKMPRPKTMPRPQAPTTKRKLRPLKPAQPHMFETSPASREQLMRLAKKLNRTPK